MNAKGENECAEVDPLLIDEFESNTWDTRRYRCQCGRAYKHHNNLRRHQSIECGKNRMRHWCIHCGKRFNRRYQLSHHLIVNHKYR
nr:zinc finger protein 707-like [Osmia lignaria]